MVRTGPIIGRSDQRCSPPPCWSQTTPSSELSDWGSEAVNVRRLSTRNSTWSLWAKWLGLASERPLPTQNWTPFSQSNPPLTRNMEFDQKQCGCLNFDQHFVCAFQSIALLSDFLKLFPLCSEALCFASVVPATVLSSLSLSLFSVQCSSTNPDASNSPGFPPSSHFWSAAQFVPFWK